MTILDDIKELIKESRDCACDADSEHSYTCTLHRIEFEILRHEYEEAKRLKVFSSGQKGKK